MTQLTLFSGEKRWSGRRERGLDRPTSARLAHLHDGGQPYPRQRLGVPEEPPHRFVGEELAPAA